MARAVLITGANLGNAEANLAAARERIGRRIGKITAHSAVMESEPWGAMEAGTGNFLNQVLVVETELSPEQVLDAAQEIEKELGRERPAYFCKEWKQRAYRSRTMDIDILFYGDAVIATPRLTVPHPLLHERRFVLEPLAGVMPGYVHPVIGKTIAELLAGLTEE